MRVAVRCCWTRSRRSSEKVSKLSIYHCTSGRGGKKGGGEEREGGKGGRGVGRRGREGEESRGGKKSRKCSVRIGIFREELQTAVSMEMLIVAVSMETSSC